MTDSFYQNARFDVPYEDHFEVYFTTPQPGTPLTLRRMYEVARTMEKDFPLLFPRVGWCTASESGFDVLIPSPSADAPAPARSPHNYNAFDGWQQQFGDDEKRGKHVFQIRMFGGVTTPFKCTEHDGPRGQALAKMASAPMPSVTIESRVGSPHGNYSPVYKVPCVYARIKYGATARHAAAFASALHRNGLLVLCVVGVDVDVETGEPIEFKYGKRFHCMQSGDLCALRTAYQMRDKLLQSRYYRRVLKKHREQPY